MMSILELLQHIVNEPAPRLIPEGRFPKEAEDFVDSCLYKDPDARKTPKDLLVRRVASPTRIVSTLIHHIETRMDTEGQKVNHRPGGVGKHFLVS